MSTIHLDLALPERTAAYLAGLVGDGKFKDLNTCVSALLQEAQQRREADEFQLEMMLMDGYTGDDPVGFREKRIQKLRELIDPALEQADRGETIPANEVFRRLEQRLRSIE